MLVGEVEVGQDNPCASSSLPPALNLLASAMKTQLTFPHTDLQKKKKSTPKKNKCTQETAHLQNVSPHVDMNDTLVLALFNPTP